MSKNKKPNLVVTKPPGEGAPFPMHQDYHYFPYEKDSMVAIFIHLDDTDVENGGLAVFPGSHKTGPLQDKSKSNLF
jgi:phytanoyl-CoA hydroxylase